MRIIPAKVGQDKFPIFIGNSVFKELKFFLEAYDKKNIFIIVDSFFKNSTSQYIEDLSFIYKYNHLFVEGGIESKTLPNFQKIFSSTCESNGYQNLISAHECSIASNEIVGIFSLTTQPIGCFYHSDWDRWTYNTHTGSTFTMDQSNSMTEMFCKE